MSFGQSGNSASGSGSVLFLPLLSSERTFSSSKPATWRFSLSAAEDAALLALYRRLGQLRRGRTSLQSGSIAYLAAEGGVLAILRQSGAERTLTALNAGDTPAELALPWADTVARSAIDGQEFFVPDGVLRLTLPPVSGMILI